MLGTVSTQQLQDLQVEGFAENYWITGISDWFTSPVPHLAERLRSVCITMYPWAGWHVPSDHSYLQIVIQAR